MSEFPTWVVVIAALIIVLLSGTALYYLIRLYKLRQHQQQALQALNERGEAQRQRVNNSIQVLAKAVGSEDLTLTEASIRISVLLDGLSVDGEIKEEFSAFYQLREATSHIPILEAWKQLDKKEKRRLSREREQLETQHSEFVLDAARRIAGRQF